MTTSTNGSHLLDNADDFIKTHLSRRLEEMKKSIRFSRLLRRFTWAINIYNATGLIYYLLTYDFFYACIWAISFGLTTWCLKSNEELVESQKEQIKWIEQRLQ
ncbi:hypothetical protein [Kurthia sp. Dielmo]|uniref:hypothetical protein n=1 Tax=Kurthia sp. Dielmo TaxID=1033738 RepID=UPI0011224691|nr:hypothetical protein [Kurthia sp. Dielmo]